MEIRGLRYFLEVAREGNITHTRVISEFLMRATVAPKIKAVSTEPRLKFRVPRSMNYRQFRKERAQRFLALRDLLKLCHCRNLLAGHPPLSGPAV